MRAKLALLAEQRRLEGELSDIAQSAGLGEHGAQRLGAGEGEDAARAGLGVAGVLEQGLAARGEPGEGQRVAPGVGVGGGGGMGVAPALRQHAEQGGALGPGLQHAAGAAVEEEEVVGGAGGGVGLAQGDAWAGVEVERGAVLHDPACGGEGGVDQPPGAGFRRGRAIHAREGNTGRAGGEMARLWGRYRDVARSRANRPLLTH